MGLIALVVGAVLVGTWLIEQHLSTSQATSSLPDTLANLFTGPVLTLSPGMIVELQVYGQKSEMFGPVQDLTQPRTVYALLGQVGMGPGPTPASPGGYFPYTVVQSDSSTFPLGSSGNGNVIGSPQVRRIITAQPSGGLIPFPVPTGV